jgi:hypothetical protein
MIGVFLDALIIIGITGWINEEDETDYGRAIAGAIIVTAVSLFSAFVLRPHIGSLSIAPIFIAAMLVFWLLGRLTPSQACIAGTLLIICKVAASFVLSA